MCGAVSFIPKRSIIWHPSSRVTPIYREELYNNSLPTSIYPLRENRRLSSTRTFRSLKKNNVKQKYNSWNIFILILGIFFTLCSLIALAIDIYLLIYTSKTKSSITLTATLRWNPNGVTIAGVTGQATAAANHLNHPYSLLFDSSNALHISDSLNNRIQKWTIGATNGTTVAGQASGISGATASDLDFPIGLCIDSNDNIYVVDRKNHRVQFWTKGASFGQTVAGTSGVSGSANNQLGSPYGIACDLNANKMYIADTGNHRVMDYLINQTSGTLIIGGQGPGTNQTQLNLPIGIYFDASTNSLLIANYAAHNVVRLTFGDSSWTIVAGNSSGQSGASSTLLNNPDGITLDPMGNLYVADSTNHRIQLFLAGQSDAITIAGISGMDGSNSTLLFRPYWVILDNQLNLIVSDTSNHRVQKFSRY